MHVLDYLFAHCHQWMVRQGREDGVDKAQSLIVLCTLMFAIGVVMLIRFYLETDLIKVVADIWPIPDWNAKFGKPTQALPIVIAIVLWVFVSRVFDRESGRSRSLARYGDLVAEQQGFGWLVTYGAMLYSIVFMGSSVLGAVAVSWTMLLVVAIADITLAIRVPRPEPK